MNLVPPLNLPLIKLPFLNSRESARAETAATLRATISRNLLCILTSSCAYPIVLRCLEIRTARFNQASWILLCLLHPLFERSTFL